MSSIKSNRSVFSIVYRYGPDRSITSRVLLLSTNTSGMCVCPSDSSAVGVRSINCCYSYINHVQSCVKVGAQILFKQRRVCCYTITTFQAKWFANKPTAATPLVQSDSLQRSLRRDGNFLEYVCRCPVSHKSDAGSTSVAIVAGFPWHSSAPIGVSI